MREKKLYLSSRLRAMSPGFVRRIYRVFRSLGTQAGSASLPERLVENCRFCSSRGRLLEHLPANGVGCEVGTYKGDFAREIMKRCRPRELHLIDIDYTHFNDEGLLDPCVTRHEGHSVDQLSGFSDEFFDWIYIDGDHSYESVLADARTSAPKIKPGGYIVFNDFAHIDPSLGRYGVHRAAVDFALEKDWPLALFAYQNSALYDVAFQKPEAAD
ncbi:MAG: class I SAM-dependent methyltransferase [Hyphomicrobiaceae bacterium]